MKIVVDRQLLGGIQQVIAPYVTCIPLDEYKLDSSPYEVDGFIIRSITKVQKEAFPKWVDSPPGFVITATAGVDHIDTAWLSSLGIQWRHCPGANARAVAEYVIAALLWMTHGTFQGSLGIVGAGATGQAVESMAQALGWSVILYDPPRERAENGFDKETPSANPFQSAEIDDLMSCDALTFHVPRIVSGENATYPLWSDDELRQAKASWIIQASRGGTVDEDALCHWANSGGHLACDVWDGEPRVRQDLLEVSTLATPHIAGYSVQSREQTFAQLATHLESLGVSVQRSKQALSGEPDPSITLSDTITSARELIETIHPWMSLSSSFKAELLSQNHNEDLFKKWRTRTPLRTEFAKFSGSSTLHPFFPWLFKLGVQKAS